VTTTALPPGMAPATSEPAAAPVARRPRTRWRRRWYRVAIPFGVLLALLVVTAVAYYSEEPNLRDPGTLSPGGTGPDGSSRLAELLIDRGVPVRHVATTDDALSAVEAGGDAVVFIPAPGFVSPMVTSIIGDLPGDHRVVLVAPGSLHTWFTDPAVATAGRRWAARAVQPGCDLPEAVAAGRATALRNRYAFAADPAGPGALSCYGGGLVRTGVGDAEVVMIGASDPFRNGRIGEHGNAELAVGLLSARDRVIWIDVHSFDLELNLRWPRLERPERPLWDRTGGNLLADLLAGYPPGVLAGLALAAVLAVLVALARARRLGPPVSEPLPVVVPAVEAVSGRGRLYQRTQGREVALEAVRAAALRRLAQVVDLPSVPAPDRDALADAVAARTGQPVHRVRFTLYGPPPTTDEELLLAVADVDHLVQTATRDNALRQQP